jgi:hypothetical protein
MFLLTLNCLSQACILLRKELVIGLKMVEDLIKSYSLFPSLVLYRPISKLSYLSLISLRRT